MDRRDALDRITDVAANDVLPAARRVVDGTTQLAEDAAVRLLGDDFDDRIRQLKQRYDQRGGDPFGLDPDTTRLALGFIAFLHRVYFRTRVHGVDQVPDGRVLLVANHSGQVPLDGMMIGASLVLDRREPRVIRAMVDKWVQTLPWVNVLFRRLGQVVGVPENCVRLLELEEAILVFPEGTRGISKPFSKRYELQEFGLGFMRLAIETGTPIVPVGVVGAEEQYINIGNARFLARAMGMPVFPIIPQLLVPGGQLPLPSRYHLYFGEPMRFEGDPDDDDACVAEQVETVRDAIRELVSQGLADRKGVFA